MYCRILTASSVPRREYKPRPIKRSPSELNGVSTSPSAKASGEMAIWCVREPCSKTLPGAFAGSLSVSWCARTGTLELLPRLFGESSPCPQWCPFLCPALGHVLHQVLKTKHQGELYLLLLSNVLDLNPSWDIILHIYTFNCFKNISLIFKKFELTFVEHLCYTLS